MVGNGSGYELLLTVNANNIKDIVGMSKTHKINGDLTMWLHSIFSINSLRNFPPSNIVGSEILTNNHGIFSLAIVYMINVDIVQ